MKKLMNWLHWLMVIPFGLFMYIGVKGGLMLYETRYEEGGITPFFLELLVCGVLSVVVVLVITYAIAPLGKMSAVVCVALLCVGFNGYLTWCAHKGVTDTTLFQAGLLTGFCALTALATWGELRSYRKRKRARQERAALEAKQAAEEAAAGE